jgi:hypothetical protein
VVFGLLDLLREKAKGGHQWVHRDGGGRLGGERGTGFIGDRRNRRFTAAGAADSGGKILQPGGDFARGRGGEIERRGRATYRHGEESKRARIKGD